MHVTNVEPTSQDQPINILLVDDDEDDYIITRNMLSESRSLDFNVDWVQNYHSAQKALATNGYDVYLLDYHLGVNNGIDLLREAIQNGCKKPLIMLTGKGNSEVDSQALRAGAADFLNKGNIDTALLERSIRYSIEQKRVERALEAETERLAVTLRSIGDAVITTDSDGKIELMNQTAERLTGWSRTEVAYKNIKEVFRIADDTTHDEIESPFVSVLKSGRPSNLIEHITLIARDGNEYNIVASVAPIFDQKNQLLGTILVFRDVTDLLKMQAELQKAQKLESLGVLAGGIAHDFNNLLTIINGNIELAKTNMDSKEEISESLGIIAKAAERAKELTYQFLTFAKGGKPIKQTVSIVNVLKESVSLCLRGSNITSELTFQEGLAKVDIDQGQISQVFNNLILNAKQAMPKKGKIKIWIENISIPKKNTLYLKEGEYVKISIQDQGKGISKENMARIFDPYFSTKQKGSVKGTGLGLSTAYSIIKNHNGVITVDSKLNRGTTFFIYLPASCASIEANHKYTKKPTFRKKKILLLDDNRMLREVVTRVLLNNNHEVIATSEGETAIKLLKSAKQKNQKFDIIILDLTLPGEISGADLIEQIRKIDPDIKAVISSGHSGHPTIVNYKQHGFDAAISKPYQVMELAELLAKF